MLIHIVINFSEHKVGIRGTRSQSLDPEDDRGVQRRRRHARTSSHPEVSPDHLLLAMLGQEGTVVFPVLQKLGVATGPAAGPSRSTPSPSSPRPTAGPTRRSGGPPARRSSRPTATGSSSATSTSRSSTSCLALTDKVGVARDDVLDRPAGGARIAPRHVAEPRGPVPGAREVRPRPHRRGPQGQARPGHRARRGDPPDDPGALPAHQEQPRPHRRAGRRQDRHRRGPRPPHRRGRRAREPQEQADRRARPRDR